MCKQFPYFVICCPIIYHLYYKRCEKTYFGFWDHPAASAAPLNWRGRGG